MKIKEMSLLLTSFVLVIYMRSLHFNSTRIKRLRGMQVPHPVDFATGLKIKP